MARNRKASPFAKNLKALLLEHGMGVREASRIAGVSVGTITNWKSGTAPDDFMAVKKLAEELGTTFSWLLTGENDHRENTAIPPLAEVFDDGGNLFDGYAKITIQRLLPKGTKKVEGVK